MKIFTGKVVGTKNDKTAMVTITRVVVHPIYKKRVTRAKKYQVHDEFGVKLGETVKFVASRPYSRTKKWKIIETVDSAKDKVQRTKKGKKV